MNKSLLLCLLVCVYLSSVEALPKGGLEEVDSEKAYFCFVCCGREIWCNGKSSNSTTAVTLHADSNVDELKNVGLSLTHSESGQSEVKDYFCGVCCGWNVWCDN